MRPNKNKNNSTKKSRKDESERGAYQEGEDVVLSDGTNDIADNAAVGVVQELDTDLGHSTTGSSTGEDLCYSGLFDGCLLGFLQKAH